MFLFKFLIPAISSSAALFSFHFQSFSSSGCFPMSRLFTSHSPSIGASASASVLPMNIQSWSPLGLTGMIFLEPKGLSRVFSSTIPKHCFYGSQPFLWSNSYIHTWLLKKKKSLIIWIFAGKVMHLLFNMLSSFVMVFFPRSKHLLISLLQSSSSVTLEPKRIISVTVSTFYPSICHEVMGLDAVILTFLTIINFTSFHSVASTWNYGLIFYSFISFKPHIWTGFKGISRLWHISLWNSAFKWVYLLFSFCFASFLFSAIYKASSDSHFAFLDFFFLGDGLDSCLLYSVMNLHPSFFRHSVYQI